MIDRLHIMIRTHMDANAILTLIIERFIYFSLLFLSRTSLSSCLTLQWLRVFKGVPEVGGSVLKVVQALSCAWAYRGQNPSTWTDCVYYARAGPSQPTLVAARNICP